MLPKRARDRRVSCRIAVILIVVGGIVFFAGEWVGGMILHLDDRRYGEERLLIASKRGEL